MKLGQVKSNPEAPWEPGNPHCDRCPMTMRLCGWDSSVRVPVTTWLQRWLSLQRRRLHVLAIPDFCWHLQQGLQAQHGLRVPVAALQGACPPASHEWSPQSGTQPNLPPACLLGQVSLSLKLVPAPPKGHVHWAKAWHLRRYQLNHLKDLEPHRREKDAQRPSRQTLYFPSVDLSPFVILGLCHPHCAVSSMGPEPGPPGS